tara:strand:- start:884 stop:1138 length:255 start_codon:yes stop_codon:yes gene_type:complete
VSPSYLILRSAWFRVLAFFLLTKGKSLHKKSIKRDDSFCVYDDENLYLFFFFFLLDEKRKKKRKISERIVFLVQFKFFFFVFFF